MLLKSILLMASIAALGGHIVVKQYHLQDFESWAEGERRNTGTDQNVVLVDGLTLQLASTCYDRARSELELDGRIFGQFVRIEQYQQSVIVELEEKPDRSLESGEIIYQGGDRVRCIFEISDQLISIEEGWTLEVL